MKMTKKTLCIVLALASFSFIGVRLNAQNDAETAGANKDRGLVVDPVALANMIKHSSPAAARQALVETMLATISAAGGRAQQEAALAHLTAAVMVTAMNTKNSIMRDALMAGLADVGKQLGDAIVNTHRQSGGIAEDTKGRVYAIIAAALELVDPVAKAGVSEEDKRDTVEAFISRVPKAYVTHVTIQN